MMVQALLSQLDNRVLCNFEPTGESDAQGWRSHRCKRCHFRTVFIPNLGQPIYRVCDDQNGELPGNELAIIIRGVGGTEKPECGCEDMVRKMNQWGVEDCRTNRPEIIAKLQENASKLGWWETGMMGTRLMREPWFRIFDPAGSMVDEAIRRAEAKITPLPQSPRLSS